VTIKPNQILPQVVKPVVLRKGDTVGLVSPASPPFEPGDIEFTTRWLSKLGLKYKLGKHIFARWNDFAGTDEQRLEDFHNLWADSEVKAVMPIRGGNGAARLLPYLDFELIAREPKIIIGFSDITALLIAISQKTGLVTFHGPTAGNFYRSSYSHHNFVKALTSSKPIGLVTDPEPSSPWKPEYPPTRLIISQGKAEGRLTGGCLTLIRQLMGSPFEIETAGKIVLIEDVQEEPHSIDRVLSQLMLAGKLKDAAGIIVGDCVKCRPGDSGRNPIYQSLSVEHVLKDRLGRLGIPVVYGMRLGHGSEQFTFPLGVMASLEADSAGVRFNIKESATVANSKGSHASQATPRD
jgi:muramoyltetrapeptide carboxypeptidase